MTDEIPAQGNARCPECKQELAEDGACPLCALAERGAPPPAPAPAIEGEGEAGDPAQPADDDNYVPQPVQLPDPLPPVAPLPQVEDAPPPENPNPGPEPDDPLAQGAGENEEAARPDETPDAHFRRRLANVRSQNLFTITLIGSSSAGKSFLLNRLKHSLSDRAQPFSASPPFAPPNSSVQRTVNMSVHMFESRRAKRSRFAVVDIPGERMTNFVDGNLIAATPVLDAIRQSSALIISIPSDVALLGEELSDIVDEIGSEPQRTNNGKLRVTPVLRAIYREHFDLAQHSDADINAMIALIADITERNKYLRAFMTGIYRMAGANSYLMSQPLQADGRMPTLTASALDHHMDSGGTHPLGGDTGINFPVFLALTKADAYLPLIRSSENERLAFRDSAFLNRPGHAAFQALLRGLPAHNGDAGQCTDARALLRTRNQMLIGQLDNWMPMTRIDFVTAFYGQDASEIVRYNLCNFGVDELIDWMGLAQKIRRGGDHANLWPTASLGGISRGALVRARNFRIASEHEGRKKDDLDF